MLNVKNLENRRYCKKEMENESVSPNICVNCSYDFRSENQIRTKRCSFLWKENTNLNEESSETEIQIVDAIAQVFGLSFQDLYLENDFFSKEIPIGNVTLCSECTLLLEKLYDSFHGMKKASHSHDNSLLWSSVNRKRSKIATKYKSRGKYRTKSSKSRTSINIKREIISEPCDDDENGFDAYTEVLTLHTPQILISENIFEDNDREDNEIVNPDVKYDFKNAKNNRIVKKTNKVRRRKGDIKGSQAERKTKKSIKTPGSRLWREFFKSGTLGPEADDDENSENNALEWKVKHLDSLSGVVPIKCCYTQFQTDADFISHVNLNHEKEFEMPEEECKFCKRKILSKYMHFHVNVLHQGKLLVYECSKCKKTFLKAGQLARHKTKEHKAFTRKNWSHLGLIKDGSKVFCDKCGKYFGYDYYIRYHLPAVHKTDDQRHPCEFCGKSMKNEAYLKIHRTLYHTGKKISKFCDKCGKVFPNYQSLKSHRTTHEADFVTDKEKFKCTQCGIILKHTAGLKKHSRLFHGKASLKTFSCEICGKTTRNMTNMRIHMKVHDPNKKHKPKNSNSEKVETPDSITPLVANSYFNL